RTVVATVETLSERAAAAGIEAPVITIIGPVVGLRDEIAWFDRRPLFGTRVVVTRAKAQAGSLAARLRTLGADVIEAAATRIEPLHGRGDLHAARVLYATAAGARDVLPEGLVAAGAEVDVVPIYRSAPDEQGASALRDAVSRGEVDLATFTSASAVQAFVAAV